jgi:hypothetical protein
VQLHEDEAVSQGIEEGHCRVGRDDGQSRACHYKSTGETGAESAGNRLSELSATDELVDIRLPFFIEGIILVIEIPFIFSKLHLLFLHRCGDSLFSTYVSKTN